MNKQLLIHGTASAQQLKELEVLTAATGISEYSEHCWQLQNAQIDEKFLKALEAYCD
jgi:hypothetical protein